MEETMSGANSFKIYRDLLKTSSPPCVPFL